MRILIRSTCKPDVLQAFAADPANAALVKVESRDVEEFDSTNPAFARLLEAAKGRSSCWFRPWTEFTPAEVASCRFLQLECRGRVLKEGRRDYETNVSRLRSLPFIENGPGARIRLLDRIALRGVKIKPNEIAGAVEWMAEFAVSRGAAQIFESEGLSGFSLQPLIDSKTGQPYADAFQLYSSHLMPRAVIDVSTPLHADHNTPHDRVELGCLTYRFRDDTPKVDFLRTAEAWSSNDMPVWIVSQRVRECYLRHKLRGWAFRPVLEPGTDLHREYLRLWNDLVDGVHASNPDHIF
jgi:hypothetical protein